MNRRLDHFVYLSGLGSAPTADQSHGLFDGVRIRPYDAVRRPQFDELIQLFARQHPPLMKIYGETAQFLPAGSAMLSPSFMTKVNDIEQPRLESVRWMAHCLANPKRL